MRAVGIILAGGSNTKMDVLSQKRAVGALPIAGSYRAIDFVLSNMTNSHIQRVAVLTQYNAWSLNEHLSSSKWWDFGRKQGGLFVFTPSITADNGFWYRGTADAIGQNLSFLKRCHEPYVIIASGDGIYKLDYNDVLEQHVQSGADMTIVCKEMAEDADVSSYGVITTDETGRVTDFEEKPLQSDSRLVSTGIYVIRRRLLIQLIEKCIEQDQFDFVSDIIMRRNQKKIQVYKLDSYWQNVASIEKYYEVNMDFLKKDVRDFFFRQYPDIYSKVEDLPPAKYNPGSDISNSLISSGCIVNGKIENSVVFKQAYIGNNCVIKNSIILNDVYIGDNSVIENCIVESHSTINPDEHIGDPKGEVQIVNERNFRYSL
ncbi:MAG: glucose-1-phosphate adenylyltransferase subunit GlgD [Eubacterium sp.]|nr:glucose-1-phosphate adenylyltransferase subunit GlgD [Eubacterium sp.]